MKKKYQIPILISILILIVLTPFGIPYLIPTPSNDYSQHDNITCFGCDDIYDPAILILLTIIIPLVIIITVIIRYFPKKEMIK